MTKKKIVIGVFVLGDLIGFVLRGCTCAIKGMILIGYTLSAKELSHAKK